VAVSLSSVATRDIRTHTPVTACDICGRTLLRGERAEVFLAGGERRNVCELCKSRALHEGWVREGTIADWAGAEGGREHRSSLLRRLRGVRRDRGGDGTATRARGRAGRDAGPDSFGLEPDPASPGSLDGEPEWGSDGAEEVPAWAEEGALPPEIPAPVPAPPARVKAPRQPRHPARRAQAPERPRETRHVRAVPTGTEHKRVAAMELFNASEHTRTIAGVARSLGAPNVAAEPAEERPSLVRLTLSWELCWYRYEVDLADDTPVVRPAGQGYELEELEAWELLDRGLMDDRGALVPRSQ
jgi:hypothetical protein